MITTTTVNPLSQPAQQPPRGLPRPNYGKIHAKPLPVRTYPLPPLIPHNPFSVLQIVFTYLFQILSWPSSHPPVPYQSTWSAETGSVHVTDEVAIRALWESGFFGKGSLSRSEPSWLDREKRRQGLLANETSEEFTVQRREERKKFKMERARKEREAIEEKLRQERRSEASKCTPEPTARARFEGMNGGPVDTLAESIESLMSRAPTDPPAPTPVVPSARTSAGEQSAPMHLDRVRNESSELTVPEKELISATTINQEHLQLTPSEAFFLAYGLGIVLVNDPKNSVTIPASELFTLFRSHSYFPPRPLNQLQSDDPFLLSYVVYHHFRSLGWVVRPGIKFAVDWLLYLRGPVFSHAEFAVIVLPAYTNQYWRSEPELDKSTRRKESKSWWWLHCVNRVQSQVRKSLVLVYVEVPAPCEVVSAENEGEIDIGRFLKQYKVRELTLKRWTPNRERD